MVILLLFMLWKGKELGLYLVQMGLNNHKLHKPGEQIMIQGVHISHYAMNCGFLDQQRVSPSQIPEETERHLGSKQLLGQETQ